MTGHLVSLLAFTLYGVCPFARYLVLPLVAVAAVLVSGQVVWDVICGVRYALCFSTPQLLFSLKRCYAAGTMSERVTPGWAVCWAFHAASLPYSLTASLLVFWYFTIPGVSVVVFILSPLMALQFFTNCGFGYLSFDWFPSLLLGCAVIFLIGVLLGQWVR